MDSKFTPEGFRICDWCHAPIPLSNEDLSIQLHPPAFLRCDQTNSCYERVIASGRKWPPIDPKDK